MYDNVVEWFEVLGKVRQDLAILAMNVYIMDKIGVMLSKDDLRDYRGTGLKQPMMIVIECISADVRPGRCSP
jgi:hypothetical protein